MYDAWTISVDTISQVENMSGNQKQLIMTDTYSIFEWIMVAEIDDVSKEFVLCDHIIL